MKKPAIEGGDPAAETFIVFGKPRLFSDEIQELMDTLRSGWIGTGPRTHAFEKQFAAYLGANHALALNSATAGLFLSLLLSDVSAGDEVITSPLTFAATANVIEHLGATPVFVDVERETFNVDPSQIEAAITKDTKAIMPVHMHGRACDMEAISTIAERNGLLVVEDAAHAVESVHRNKKIGTLSPFSVFSFYATKNLTTAEGGMLILQDEALLDRARVLSLHGISKDAWSRYSSSGYVPYETVVPGFKFNMTDVQAALGLHQLKRLNENHVIRERYWQRYMAAFSELEGVLVPAPVADGDVHGYHLFALVLELEKLSIDRNRMIEVLQAENIGTGVHFTSLHTHRYYRQTYGYSNDDFPIAAYLSERLISLPLYPHMDEDELEAVITGVTKVIEYYRL